MQREISAKQYFASYHADSQPNALSTYLINLIVACQPRSVFEFGCGTGRNLMAIKNRLPDVDLRGIDVSAWNVEEATRQLGLGVVFIGDENLLPLIVDYDVAFTCGVLDHIPHVLEIMSELCRIGRRRVFLAETMEDSTPFYYSHRYEGYGFRRVNQEPFLLQDGHRYYVFTLPSVQ